jgi:hypothetical protein
MEHRILHRIAACDLSLFKLGPRLQDHLLDEELTIPMVFTPWLISYICVR